MFWPMENQYHNGTVEQLGHTYLVQSSYDDGDKGVVTLAQDDCKYEDNAMEGSKARSLQTFASYKPMVLSKLLDEFGNKLFMLNKAKGFEHYLLVHAYKTDEEQFRWTVKRVPRHSVHPNSNIIL